MQGEVSDEENGKYPVKTTAFYRNIQIFSRFGGFASRQPHRDSFCLDSIKKPETFD